MDGDGLQVLVDPIWPRFEEFERRYRLELVESERVEALTHRISSGTATPERRRDGFRIGFVVETSGRSCGVAPSRDRRGPWAGVR
jgi:hypothetical protein